MKTGFSQTVPHNPQYPKFSAPESIHKPRKPRFKFLSFLSLFSLHQLFFSDMSVRYHRISLLKTAVNNVSVPDLSALERTVWNFLATCIELGKLKKKSNVALCDWMMGWNCMRYRKSWSQRSW